MSKKWCLLLSFLLVFSASVQAGDGTATAEKTTKAEDQAKAAKAIQEIALGTALFFDVNLSKNRTMSCSTCHDPATGFVDQRGKVKDNMASLGDDGKSIGDRNAPTAAYALSFPRFQKNNNCRDGFRPVLATISP